ncbi:hypothetical protein RND71_032006 [Anisodus tanguticus]|uniref:Uncharacterized protein n=1 Tax=Anisodus tanguticus TaxID=243964 RepID=A0AAE1RDR2_9SOLA|nr:hypothetical protein RND71_032006 [Anisodus tanguticus]
MYALMRSINMNIRKTELEEMQTLELSVIDSILVDEPEMIVDTEEPIVARDELVEMVNDWTLSYWRG